MTSPPSSEPTAASLTDAGTWRDWSALTISGFGVALLGVLWTVVAGRFLSHGEFADFTAGASLIYFSAMALGPLSQTIAYFTAHNLDHGESIRSAFRALERRIILGSTVGFVVFAVISPLLREVLRFRSALSLWVVYLAAATLLVSAIRRGFIQGQSRFRLYSANIGFEAIVRLALLLLVCLVLPAAATGLATYAVAAIVALLLLPIPARNGNAEIPRLGRYFGLSLSATLLYSAFLYTDVVLVKLFFSSTDTAHYGAAALIGRGAGMLVAPFSVYALPHLTTASGKELRRRFLRLCALFGTLELAAVGALFFCRRALVTLLVGPGYAAAAGLIPPISIAVAIGGFTFIASQLLVAKGQFDFVIWYAAGYVMLVGAVVIRHDSLVEVVVMFIAAQVVTLMLIAPSVFRSIPASA